VRISPFPLLCALFRLDLNLVALFLAHIGHICVL
jgi:hypothetical protein